MSSIKIAPSILSADFGRLAEDVKKVCDAGADLIHVDVMDGHFVPNLTLGPCIVEAVKKAATCPVDVHLMITNAEASFQSYIDAGADMLSVHVEAVYHLHGLVQKIKAQGIKASVALNPATPIGSITPLLSELDMVLIMTVNPGFGGQSFIDSCFQKISELKTLRDQNGWKFDIQVDGGVKLDNIKRVVEAGANVIVSGSGIFKQNDIPATMAKMKKTG